MKFTWIQAAWLLAVMAFLFSVFLVVAEIVEVPTAYLLASFFLLMLIGRRVGPSLGKP